MRHAVIWLCLLALRVPAIQAQSVAEPEVALAPTLAYTWYSTFFSGPLYVDEQPSPQLVHVELDPQMWVGAEIAYRVPARPLAFFASYSRGAGEGTTRSCPETICLRRRDVKTWNVSAGVGRRFLGSHAGDRLTLWGRVAGTLLRTTFDQTGLPVTEAYSNLGGVVALSGSVTLSRHFALAVDVADAIVRVDTDRMDTAWQAQCGCRASFESAYMHAVTLRTGIELRL